MKKPNQLPLFLLSLLFAASCGGGGSSSSDGAPTVLTSSTTNVYVGSTGSQGLFAFEADLSELYLVAEDGTSSVDLISNDTTVEFVGLEGRACLVGGAVVEDGTYTSVRAVFDPSSVSAMAENGDVIDVLVADETWIAELDQSLLVAGGTSNSVYLELDLEASMNGGPTQVVAGAFAPEGDAFADPSSMEVDEFEGVVLSASLIDGSLQVDAFAAPDRPLGVVDVNINAETTLLDVDGSRFLSDEEFFSALILGVTVVEVRGVLEGGKVTAQSVEIEDPDSPLVEMEGRVLHVGDDLFVFLIREIEEGADIAGPVLDSIGNPSSIDVYWSEGTRFVLRDGSSASPDQLRIGQILKVQFQEFSSPPFVTSQVEFEHDAHVLIHGTIVDISGLPESFVMRTISGDVFGYSDSIDVTVDVTVADIVLTVHRNPTLDPSQLVKGLKVSVEGDLDEVDEPGDTGETRTFIAARRVRVRAGKLKRAMIAVTHPDGSAFDTVGGFIVGSFGDEVTAGPLHAVLQEGARFQNDARTQAEFFSLFEDLKAGEELTVEVRGIGSEESNEILCFVIKAKVFGEHNGDDGSTNR